VGIGDVDFGVQVGIGLIGRVVAAVVAFVGSIVLARALGPSDYGAFYLLLAVVAFLDNPVTGWAQACRKRLTETDFPSGEALGSTLIGILFASVVVFGIARLTAPFIAGFTGNQNGWLLLSVLFVGMVSYHTADEVLKSTERFGSSSWLLVGRDTTRVFAQVSLIAIGFGIVGMVGGMVFANLILAPVVLYVIGIRPCFPSAESLRAIWSYARYSIPGGVVSTAQERMDRLILGFLASPAVVGNYEVAIKLTIPAMFVAGVAQDGLMGRISNRVSRGDAVARDVRNNLAYASVIGIPLFFGAATMAKPVVVTLYSNQYAAAAPFLAGLALFRLLRTQKAILVSTINGLDLPDVNFRISLGVFSFNLLAGVGLLFTIGPIGVVIATIISELFGYGVRAYLVKVHLPTLTLYPRGLLDQIASGILMAGVVYITRQALPLATWPYVIVVVGVGAVTYTVTLVSISAEFRSTVRAVLRDAGVRAS
jgi:O-antigen/teichoic acid export membrane protein